MAGALLGAILALLLALGPPPASATPSASSTPSASATPLEQRITAWPQWSLPAPLQRPGRRDLPYPAWFAGDWQVQSSDGLLYRVRFQRQADGSVLGDRAFNAEAVGRALLGEQLLRVANDPANPNRQIAWLAGDQRLESTVIGRGLAEPEALHFLADELSLQVLHRPGAPRLSQVETLSRYRLLGDGTIEAEQWQARYPPPGAALQATPEASERFRLRLRPLPPDSGQPAADPAS